MTPDFRILGTVQLGAPKTFVGNETTETVSAKVLPVAKRNYNRVRDNVAVEFMYIPVTDAQEKNSEHYTFPSFTDVSTSTPMGIWTTTGAEIIPANRSLSALQSFLASSAFA